MKSVAAVIFGTALCFMGTCSFVTSIGDPPTQQLGGVTIAFVLLVIGVPTLIYGARRKDAPPNAVASEADASTPGTPVAAPARRRSIALAVILVIGFFGLLARYATGGGHGGSSKSAPRAGAESSASVAPPSSALLLTAPGPEERAKLLATMNAKKDEFKNVTFYEAKGRPILGSQIYLYIVASESGYVLRLVATYEGDDWVFWHDLNVKADDRVLTLTPTRDEIDHANSSGTVWETADLIVAKGIIGNPIEYNEPAGELFNAVMGATSASMRFEGEHDQRDRKMPAAELARFKQVGWTYKKLFGAK